MEVRLPTGFMGAEESFRSSKRNRCRSRRRAGDRAALDHQIGLHAEEGG